MSGVDVVAPPYNYGRFLPGCVNNILDQQDADVRALVNDDTSGDDAPHIGRRLAAPAQRVESLWARCQSRSHHTPVTTSGAATGKTSRYSVCRAVHVHRERRDSGRIGRHCEG
jgi:hypothetical protein